MTTAARRKNLLSALDGFTAVTYVHHRITHLDAGPRLALVTPEQSGFAVLAVRRCTHRRFV
jgi:hypothetical protein